MALDFLHADHIGAQGRGFEPQRVSNILLYIAGLQEGAAGQAQSGQEDILTLSLSSFPVPKVNNAVLEIGWMNEKRKFAGPPTFDDLSVIYKDYVDQQTANLLLKWRHQVYDPNTGKIGLASAYKKTGWVAMFSPEGSVERRYDVIGIWPSAFDPGDADLQGEDTINITCTLTIDKAIPSRGLAPEA